MRRGKRSVAGALAGIGLFVPLLAIALAGCNTTGSQTHASLPGTRGATVAFDSIDGAPREVFDRLVRGLNAEARSQNLAVVSRTDPSAFRVRGYFVAETEAKESAIHWVWDVYDNRQQRVLRISGKQTVSGENPWQALGDPAVERIARDSIGQLATFLTSPDVMPSARARVAAGDGSSPEAAGIFRIVPAVTTAQDLAPEQDLDQDDVPLPPHRPGLARTASLIVATVGTN
jgi:hypothetical protein